uniref:PX domain-containing protein n=1 Tax=Amphiprion ocellaris TaxID=80972 RepID=A0AAQ5X4D3_AMPOC
SKMNGLTFHYGRHRWTVKHRYSDFHDLHEKLAAEKKVDRRLLPPKKILGKNSKSLVERRQKELELYLQTLLLQFPQATPTALACFLHFHLYEINGITAALAEELFHKGEQLLQAGEVFCLRPLQLYSVSQQLRLAKPTCCNGDARTDLGHILDFTCRLRYLKICGSRGLVGSSNIQESSLPFDLSVFKSLLHIQISDCSSEQIEGLSTLRTSLETMNVHQSTQSMMSVLVPEAAEFPQWEPEGAESVCPVTALVPVWRQLTTLDLSHNGISCIDTSVRLIPKVEFLDLSSNQLFSVENLQHLYNLVHVDLSYNNLQVVEAAHTRLGNIKTLNLAGNQLQNLSGLSKLYSLVNLDLSQNQLDQLEEIRNIGSLPCLEKLSLAANPMCIIPDYRTKVLAQFGDRAAEVCLDSRVTTEKELDTVEVLKAIQKAKEVKHRMSSGDKKVDPATREVLLWTHSLSFLSFVSFLSFCVSFMPFSFSFSLSLRKHCLQFNLKTLWMLSWSWRTRTRRRKVLVLQDLVRVNLKNSVSSLFSEQNQSGSMEEVLSRLQVGLLVPYSQLQLSSPDQLPDSCLGFGLRAGSTHWYIFSEAQQLRQTRTELTALIQVRGDLWILHVMFTLFYLFLCLFNIQVVSTSLRCFFFSQVFLLLSGVSSSLFLNQSELEDLKQVLWLSVVLYKSPEAELTCCLLLSTDHIYFLLEDSVSDAGGPDSILVCCLSISLSELLAVNVGLFDQYFRVVGGSADHIVCCLSRDSYGTGVFLQELMATLSLQQQLPPPEPSDQDFYSQFTHTCKMQNYELVHSSQVKFIYPSEEEMGDLTFIVAERKTPASCSRSFNVLLYLLVFQVRSSGPSAILQPRTLILTSTDIFLLDEDYVSYPLPDFAKEPPSRERYQLREARRIRDLDRVLLGYQTYPQALTLVFDDLPGPDLLCHLTMDHFAAAGEEALPRGGAEGEVQWCVFVPGADSRERLISLLARQWEALCSRELPVELTG